MNINYIHDTHNENETKERDLRTHTHCVPLSHSHIVGTYSKLLFFITNSICNSTFHRPEFL
jgi:hypothetical protein